MSNDSKSSKTLTAEIVTARLDELSELSRVAVRRAGIDMSAEAVTARLLELSDLSKLCAQLGELALEAGWRARPVVPNE